MIKRWTFWRSTEWAGFGFYWYKDDFASWHHMTCFQASMLNWHLTFRPYINAWEKP